MSKSTISKIGDTWSFFCGACWKYSMGHESLGSAIHGLYQHWQHFKKNPGKYARHK